ncbi:MULTISPECIES: FimB/Mfa2 family fimbrial subunit [unclassified Bacteroides]|uniref:FimB/Mfa2 family fimbrial subunit n=1 Tax=unclassified Bacteroides TaxID=2646097 RepID=UPI0040640389
MKIPSCINRLRACVASLFVVVALGSCGSIYDEEGDCTPQYRLTFRYDMNMKYADAFAHEVKSLALYVFNEDGIFVKSYTENDETLLKEGYHMPVDLPAGSYRYVVWGGLNGKNKSYKVPDMKPGVSRIEELTCSMNLQREKDEALPYVAEIDPLYHGMGSFVLPEAEGVHTVNIPLTKDTNVIRVVLQNLSGENLDPRKFRFTITDDNSVLKFDNSLSLAGNIAYRPFSVGGGKADIEGGVAGSAITTVLAEFTVGRLLKEHSESAVLTITDEKGEKILSIPLIDYVLLVKGKYNEALSDQEYLDRQDEYNLVFFLDDRGSWISSQIIINGWKLVLNDVEL